MEFTHDTLAQRVRFGSGAAADNLRAEIDELGARRVMVIAGERESELAHRVASGLPVVLWHHDVVMHVPVEVAERARAAAGEHEVDVLVAVGGGSTTGLAKAIALTSGLPIVVVPTTYAGSEATPVWGLTSGAEKKTGSDVKALPRAVVYDAALTLTLPAGMSVASGLNAVAHCVDSMWAPRADPINAAYAVEGLRALAEGLPQVQAEPEGLPGREQLLYGAYLAGLAFASAGSGMHHKICHVLGGMFDLPHAETHAIVLPHVLAFNAPAAPHAERRIAVGLGSANANQGLADLRDQLDAPKALRDIGMPADGVDTAVRAVLAAIPESNPRPVDADTIRTLLRAAWEGDIS